MLQGIQQQQQHYEYSIEGPPGNGNSSGQNPRMIASELNSYQSEKKISGNG